AIGAVASNRRDARALARVRVATAAVAPRACPSPAAPDAAFAGRRTARGAKRGVLAGRTQLAPRPSLEALPYPVARVHPSLPPGPPGMPGGRVQTLHPRIHAENLARRDPEEDVGTLVEHGIEPLDLVCVNLCPFEEVASRQGVTEAEAAEMIDVGGPSMLRGA